jgi:hypothetical protein
MQHCRMADELEGCWAGSTHTHTHRGTREYPVSTNEYPCEYYSAMQHAWPVSSKGWAVLVRHSCGTQRCQSDEVVGSALHAMALYCVRQCWCKIRRMRSRGWRAAWPRCGRYGWFGQSLQRSVAPVVGRCSAGGCHGVCCAVRATCSCCTSAPGLAALDMAASCDREYLWHRSVFGDRACL